MNSLRKNLLKTALLAVTLCALPALAGPDTYGLGTGKDGALTVASTGLVINTYAQVTAPAAPGDTTLVVGSTTGFATGDLVLVLQMTGIVPEPPSGGSSPVDITNDPVGRWELARITGISGTTLTVDEPLVYSYAADVTQIIRVPEYTTVTINATRNITAPAWNGSTGGVVAFLANGTVANNFSPGILVTGKGFRGGVSVNDSSGSTGCSGLDEPAPGGAQKGEGIAFTRYGPSQTGRGRVANAGAGGVCLSSGGGGGGNGGSGGQGGNTDLGTDGNRAVGGQGGAALTFGMLNHLIMGGGGGAGHGPNAAPATGGAGGGIVFLRANALSGPGSIVANGATGGSTLSQDGASGGGGGGTIYLRVAGAAACGLLQTIGGTGGNANGGVQVGPGGGGGGGRILLQKGSGTCTTTASSLIGASAGVQQDSSAPGGAQYGAQAGVAGSATTIPTGFPATMPVPVVTTPANGSVTTNNKPPYSGTLATTAPAGTQVAIYVDGAFVTNVTADASGNWTFTPTVALSDGAHSLYAVAVNAANAVQSVKSNTNTFTVDTTPPPAPVVINPPNNSRTNNNKPTYTGTAEANTTVTVLVDGVSVGTTTANASGNWTFTQPTALVDGTHSVKATATDAAGNTSVDSNTNLFIVDTTPPPAPVVVTPADGARTNNNTPTYTGTAEANSTVAVYVDGTQVGTTTADASGNWSFTQPTALADGTHSVKATATDATGNTSVDSNTNTFLVDTVPPPAPVVFTPADGSIINNNRPVYTGSASGAVLVHVFVDGVEVGTAVVTGGSWSFTQPLPALLDGTHTVMVTSVDGAGNTSPNSNTNTFIVDTAPPAAPVVVTPADGSRTNNNRPAYTGTAEPNSTVTVYVDGTQVGTATASASGAWTFTQPTALSDGSHQVKATATDIAGNVSPDSNTNTFTVDTTPPPAPVVVTPANGSRTNDNTPTYTGTAEPNSTVTVYVDGVALATTTTADASGNWTLTQPTALADGNHQVKARATDAAGNTSVDSNTNTFTVDTTPPLAPVVINPPNGSSTSNNRPAYTGTAEPGSTVTVYVDGAQVGTTTADASGNWTFTQPTVLADGSHSVKATATDSVGNVSPDSNTNTFTVDTVAPAAPVVVTPADGSRTNDTTPTYSGTAEPNSTVTIIVDGSVVGTTTANASGAWSFTPIAPLAEGSHQVKAMSRDAANNASPDSNTNTFTVDVTAPAAPVVSTPADGSRTNDTTPTYSGTAEAGSTVTIIVDGNPVGTATADASGNWSFTPTTPLGEGSHTVNATATDVAGNTGPASNTNTFTVDVTAPTAPVVSTPADGSRTNDTTPTYSGTAEAGSTVTIIVDGSVVGTTTANASGAWSFTPTTPLAEGSHQVKATATDVAGNTSPDSNTNTFTVDVTAPAAPVVTTPADGSRTNDTTPTYSGTAEAGSTVTIIVDGSPVGTATADASGNWSFTPTTPLAEGSHTVNATATDVAGNTGPSSSTNTFTVDLTAPAAPVVTTPANGAVLGDNTPTYTGTAEAGSTVTVIVDGAPVGTTTADASGNWSFTPTTGLSNGQHSVKATATDVAGNTSPDSNTNTFTVNATIPNAPVVTGPADGTVTSDTTPTYTGTAEPGSTVTVLINGNPVGTTTADAAGNWTLTPTTPLPDAQYTLTATATNNAGNVSPPSSAVHFTVDTAAPDTTIVSGPSGDTQDTSATFDFSSSDASATFECSLDGGAYAACTDPSTFENLAPGSHTLSVRARDSAGNVDPTPATATWNVVEPTPENPNLNFRGGGVGCASTGGDPSALAMMGLGLLSALLARKRRA